MFIPQVQLHLNPSERFRKQQRPLRRPVCSDTHGRNNKTNSSQLDTTRHIRRRSSGRRLHSCWYPEWVLDFSQRGFQSAAGTKSRDVCCQPARDHGSQNNNNNNREEENKSARPRTFCLPALSRTEASSAAAAASFHLAGGAAALFFAPHTAETQEAAPGRRSRPTLLAKHFPGCSSCYIKVKKGEAAAQLL